MLPALKAKQQIQITALTHRGRVRDINQDCIAVGGWLQRESMENPKRFQFPAEASPPCILADGLGGHRAGEWASEFVARRLSQMHGNLGLVECIAKIQSANSELYSAVRGDPDREGTGTTVVGLMFSFESLVWFNVGDSRLYREEQGHLIQVSIDDVPLANKRELGGFRKNHLVTQTLGGSSAFHLIRPHVGTHSMQSPSRWLLCSDGLTDMLDESLIESSLALDDAQAVKALFESAMAAGGEDNISLVIVSVGESASLGNRIESSL